MTKDNDLENIIMNKNRLTLVGHPQKEDFKTTDYANQIEPDHYNKGEIDLYDSWYLTYPFNEFRAGLQMITDRYIRRNKNDRVEDLNKAIYTLERLIEYEETEKEVKE